jgi:WD40 repeat protein
MTLEALPRGNRRRWLPAVIVTVIGMVAATFAHLWTTSGPAVIEPVFPSTVASYDWWTTPLAASDTEAAILLYQNGIGVEFLDIPQAVILGSNGSTYRRLGAAERAGVPADQGDPARSELSPDGTFVIFGDAETTGEINVVTVHDDTLRSLSIGEGRAVVPVSIGADGNSALLLSSAGSLSRYLDEDLRLHGALVSVNLTTGAVRTYPELSDVSSAALSPDGSTIAADTPDGLVVFDTMDRRTRTVNLPSAITHYIDGDAWSPNGDVVAFLSGSQLHTVDASALQPSLTTVTLPGVGYGTAIGWRDDETVLVHTNDGSGDNRSVFSWVDAETGIMERFSDYAPDLTGAALGSVDAARDLVPVMQVTERPNDRGLLPLAVNLFLALVLGGTVFALSSRPRGTTR